MEIPIDFCWDWSNSSGIIDDFCRENPICQHIPIGENYIDLRSLIDTSILDNKEVKCRITYSDKIQQIEYENYVLKSIQSLKPLEIGNYTYTFKFKDRDRINHFYSLKEEADDVLLLKDGYITDTSYANVALLKDGKWFTPKSPLLNGTSRTRFLKKGIIQENVIHINDIQKYEKLSIFNSMIPFRKIELEIGKIQ